ncbi:MAG: transpeptidase family protein [Chitinophagaceae bacterium]|nr:transpeptidase family protein [Chitinophagaceae bacterium]
MEIRKDILWRVYLSFIGIVILGIIVLGKAFYIQRVEGHFWTNMDNTMHLKYLPVDAERGTIYSEDGNMLSTSIPVFDVYVDFAAEGLRAKDGKRFKDHADTLSTCLANLFKDKSANAYLAEMKQAYDRNARYYLLKKSISFTEYKELRDFPLVNLGKNKSGFIINSMDKRINPYVLLANRTIGLARKNASNVGLEHRYDSLLKGKAGQQLVRYMAGSYMPVDGGDVDPENGKDIISTIDTYIQDVTESALMRMMVNNNSLHGTAMVMETATGKIKAIANLGKQADGNYTEDLNYGIGKATEPGSVFKLATLMSLLEDKYVTINSVVNCEGGKKSFYGLTIKDSHLGTYELTVKEAFERSSNVAFAKLADQYYSSQPNKFIDHLRSFRLDKMTGVDLTASSGKPTIKSPANRSWSKTTIPYMAHGYEELVTPLHMLMLYNAVANNGKMMKPYLVSSIKQYGVEVRSIVPEVLVDKICSNETLTQLKECLLAVVQGEHGTARIIKDSAYLIAGKTGTAVTAMDNRGYNKGNKIYQASFIGYFPADNPKYTMAVVIQNSKESKKIYGADVSGTVFKEISDRIFGSYLSTRQYMATGKTDSAACHYFGMKNEWASIFTTLNMSYKDMAGAGSWRSVQINNNEGTLNTPSVSNSISGSVTPNVAGMGLKDAVYLLENLGLKVTATGRGRVINQSIAPETNFIKNQNIALILN